MVLNVKPKINKFNRNSSGFTFIELLVVMVLALIVSSFSILNFRDFENPLKNDTASFKGFINKVKLKAMSHTMAFKIENIDSNTVNVYHARNCDSSVWNIDNTSTFKLSDKVSFSNTDWSVCFNSRGFPSDNLEVGLLDNKGKAVTLNLMLAGAVYAEQP